MCKGFMRGIALILAIFISISARAYDEDGNSERTAAEIACPYGYINLQTVTFNASFLSTRTWQCESALSSFSNDETVVPFGCSDNGQISELSYVFARNCFDMPTDDSNEEGCSPSDEGALAGYCSNDKQQCYDSSGNAYWLDLTKSCEDYCRGPAQEYQLNESTGEYELVNASDATGSASIHACNSDYGDSSSDSLAGSQSEMGQDLAQCGSGSHWNGEACEDIPDGCGYVNGDYYCPDDEVGDGSLGDTSSDGSSSDDDSDSSDSDSGSSSSDEETDEETDSSGEINQGGSGAGTGYESGGIEYTGETEEVESCSAEAIAAAICTCYEDGDNTVCEQAVAVEYDVYETCPFEATTCTCDDDGCWVPNNTGDCESESCCTSEYYEWLYGSCSYKWDCSLGQADYGYGCEDIPSCGDGKVWNGSACIDDPTDDSSSDDEDDTSDDSSGDSDNSEELNKILGVLEDIEAGTAQISDVTEAIEALKESNDSGNEDIISELEGLASQLDGLDELSDQTDILDEIKDILVASACAVGSKLESCPDQSAFSEGETEYDDVYVTSTFKESLESTSVYAAGQKLIDADIVVTSSCNLEYAFEIEFTGETRTYVIDACQYIVPSQNLIRTMFLMFWALVALFRLFSA